MVSRLVKKVKSKPEILNELIQKQEDKRRLREEIGEYIFNLNEIDHFIDSAETV